MGDMWQHANDKQQLLDQIASEYARLVALVDRFSDAERVKPLVETNSLKDMLAHITDWETYALRRLRTTAIGESLPLRVPDGDFDRVNAEIYAAHKERLGRRVAGFCAYPRRNGGGSAHDERKRSL